MPRNVSTTSTGNVLAWSLFLVLLACQALVSVAVSRTRPMVPPEAAGENERASLLWQIARRPDLSFGFRNFLADITWLRAVQIAGSPRMSPGDYDRLEVLLKMVGNLDPRFEVPYLLGAMILGDSPKHVNAALEELERGKAYHPNNWRFPFYIGYIEYFSLGDPVKGGNALREAARIPGSPPYLPLLASRMFTEGREPKTALALLRGILQQETDAARIGVLEARIRDVIVERDIEALEKAVSAYQKTVGALPETLRDLVRAHLIRRIPEEPNGGRYVLSPDGTVRSTRVRARLKVFRNR